MLQGMASPMMAAPALAALMGLDATLVLVTLVASTALVPFTASLFAGLFLGDMLQHLAAGAGPEAIRHPRGIAAGRNLDPMDLRRGRDPASQEADRRLQHHPSSWPSRPRSWAMSQASSWLAPVHDRLARCPSRSIHAARRDHAAVPPHRLRARPGARADGVTAQSRPDAGRSTAGALPPTNMALFRDDAVSDSSGPYMLMPIARASRRGR